MNKIGMFLMFYVLPCILDLLLLKVTTITFPDIKVEEWVVVLSFVPFLNLGVLFFVILEFVSNFIVDIVTFMIKWIVK
jgi:hypothetical protein